jgi:hypothetical protein
MQVCQPILAIKSDHLTKISCFLMFYAIWLVKCHKIDSLILLMYLFLPLREVNTITKIKQLSYFGHAAGGWGCCSLALILRAEGLLAELTPIFWAHLGESDDLRWRLAKWWETYRVIENACTSISYCFLSRSCFLFLYFHWIIVYTFKEWKLTKRKK